MDKYGLKCNFINCLFQEINSNKVIVWIGSRDAGAFSYSYSKNSFQLISSVLDKPKESFLTLRSSVKVVMVSVYENDEMVFKSLCEGASGYLTKNIPSSKLIDSLKELENGGAPMSTNIARMVVSSFHRNHQSPLTVRELEVLQRLASGKSYSTIADNLFVDKETIRSHIKNIYLKLEVHSKAEAIEKAKKNKFI